MDEHEDTLVGVACAIVVALAVMTLSGCYAQVGGTGEPAMAVRADAPIETPPWLEGALPFRVWVDDAMGEPAVASALQAVYDVNEAAGGELLDCEEALGHMRLMSGTQLGKVWR